MCLSLLQIDAHGVCVVRSYARAGSKHRFFKKSGGAKGASLAGSLASEKLFLKAKALGISLCSLPMEAERNEVE
ncbi:MAG: hypothetical protein J7K72_00595 [Candidatus Aenigmarchaeota archaeon]|nr:hypothetical protein [Candidatus Aenigmarchaeota archaeon]